jgi:hypothetical protein
VGAHLSVTAENGSSASVSACSCAFAFSAAARAPPGGAEVAEKRRTEEGATPEGGGTSAPREAALPLEEEAAQVAVRLQFTERAAAGARESVSVEKAGVAHPSRTRWRQHHGGEQPAALRTQRAPKLEAGGVSGRRRRSRRGAERTC